MNENDVLLCEYGSEVVKGLLVRIYWINKADHEDGPELLLYVKQNRDSYALWIQIEEYGFDEETAKIIHEEAYEYLDTMSEQIVGLRIDLSDGSCLRLTLTTLWYSYTLIDAFGDIRSSNRKYYPGATLQAVLSDIQSHDANVGTMEWL